MNFLLACRSRTLATCRESLCCTPSRRACARCWRKTTVTSPTLSIGSYRTHRRTAIEAAGAGAELRGVSPPSLRCQSETAATRARAARVYAAETAGGRLTLPQQRNASLRPQRGLDVATLARFPKKTQSVPMPITWNPWSTCTVAPVIPLANGLHKNADTYATSSSVRRSGIGDTLS